MMERQLDELPLVEGPFLVGLGSHTPMYGWVSEGPSVWTERMR